MSNSLRFLSSPYTTRTCLSTYKHRTGIKLNEDNSHVEAELLGIGLHSEFPSKTLSLEKDI